MEHHQLMSFLEQRYIIFAAVCTYEMNANLLTKVLLPGAMSQAVSVVQLFVETETVTLNKS